MTTDQKPYDRIGGLDALDTLGDGTDYDGSRAKKPQLLKKLTSPKGVGIEVSQWINDDGSKGNIQVRMSRQYYAKKYREYRWENLTLKVEDLCYLHRVIQAMADGGLLVDEEISFD